MQPIADLFSGHPDLLRGKALLWNARKTVHFQHKSGVDLGTRFVQHRVPDGLNATNERGGLPVHCCPNQSAISAHSTRVLTYTNFLLCRKNKSMKCAWTLAKRELTGENDVAFMKAPTFYFRVKRHMYGICHMYCSCCALSPMILEHTKTRKLSQFSGAHFHT